MAFSHTFDTNAPDGEDDPTEADNNMRRIQAAIQERLNVEHVFDLTGTEVSGANTGKHTDITTTSIVNAGAFANTGNLAINNNKFTIDAATGNVVVAGTLGVTGIATLAKGSLLASLDAPTTDAMLTHKKYVDDQDIDSVGDGVSKSKDTNYTAATSGTLVVMSTDTWVYNVTHTVLIKSDDLATPTTVVAKAGGKCTRGDSANNIVYQTITVKIIKGKKYRVEDVGSVIDSITFYPDQ